MLSKEAYYLACLLECGAPAIHRTNTYGGPVSTTHWLRKTHDWWFAHHPDAAPSRDQSYDVFCEWWTDYKKWIVEQTNGQ